MPAREAVISFISQACCGTMMAVFRMGNSNSVDYADRVVVLLSKYFNNCWMSLLKGDDPFVNESFGQMGHDCPICVIRKLFEWATAALPEKAPESLQGEVPTQPIALEAIRLAVTSELLVKLDSLVPQDMWEHKCDALNLETERALWVKNGSPQEELFVIEQPPQATQTLPEIGVSI